MIPFIFFPKKILDKFSGIFMPFARQILRNKENLQQNLDYLGYKINSEEYLATAFASDLLLFLILFGGFLVFTFRNPNWFLNITIPLIIIFFVLFQQIKYPELKINKKTREIDKNIVPALREIKIQVDSGNTLFDALTYVSRENYGELSSELSKALKKISSGTSEITAIQNLAAKTKSEFFKKTLNQIITGLHTGASLSNVLKDIIKNISDEQLIQIREYGSRLNPLAMFYMLAAAVIPALAIVFLLVFSSFVGIGAAATRTLFIVLFLVIMLIQFLFIGMIKNRMPDLI